eukprot:5519932-Alexandrium_andersonii.AAC.1
MVLLSLRRPQGMGPSARPPAPPLRAQNAGGSAGPSADSGDGRGAVVGATRPGADLPLAKAPP